MSEQLDLDIAILTRYLQLTYTIVIIFVNVTAQHLCNYLPAGVYETLSPQDIKDAVFGSKSVFITEEFILATLWLCKACLLILYSGLTTGLPKQHRLVKWVGAYCVFGYVFVQIFFLGVWCRPLEQYWWVPVQNCKSTTACPINQFPPNRSQHNAHHTTTI